VETGVSTARNMAEQQARYNQHTPNVRAVMLIFAVSFAAALLIVLTKPMHGSLTTRTAVTGHATHTKAIARIGGLAILAGLAASRAVHPDVQLLHHALGFGSVAFAIGFIEDLSHRVSPLQRLAMCSVAAGLAGVYGGHVIHRIDVPMIDPILEIEIVGLFFTAFAVSGLCSAINMIDGKNGLAAGSVIASLSGVLVLAGATGQQDLEITATSMILAALGFMFLNWPIGKIFMGDGGAYLLGFGLGLCLVEMPKEGSVSAWASLVVVLYPVTEVLHSAYRRHSQRRRIDEPDQEHLHHLLQSRLVDKLMSGWGRTSRNSAVAPIGWLLSAIPVTWALAFRSQPTELMLGAVFYVVGYFGMHRILHRRQR